jgi:hypothetical protein
MLQESMVSKINDRSSIMPSHPVHRFTVCSVHKEGKSVLKTPEVTCRFCLLTMPFMDFRAAGKSACNSGMLKSSSGRDTRISVFFFHDKLSQ